MSRSIAGDSVEEFEHSTHIQGHGHESVRPAHVLPARPATGAVAGGHRRDDSAESARDLNVEPERREERKGVVRGRLSKFESALDDAPDFGANKEGVMSEDQAVAFEVKVFSSLVNDDGITIMQLTEAQRVPAKASWLAYLALNSGSTNGEDGHSVTGESETLVDVGGYSIAGKELKQLMGQEAYRYMRARAGQIHKVLVKLGERAIKVNSDGSPKFPNAVAFVRLMVAVAARRSMEQYWTYSFVGAEFVPDLPPRMRDRIQRTSAAILGVRGDGGSLDQETITGRVAPSNRGRS